MSEAQSTETKKTKKPNEKRKAVRQQAKKAAADKGVEWESLSKDERRGFRQAAREERKARRAGNT